MDFKLLNQISALRAQLINKTMNKITLKSLKAELENLKGSKVKASSKSPVVKAPKTVV
jgi:hypothetical protein